jgi:hypothetical protein
MSTDSEPASDFGPPFDFDDGDVYLRSVDGCHFRVHRTLLSTASHTFREMLSAGFGDEQRNGLPVIPFLAAEEHETTVAAFLRIIYPVAFPVLEYIADFRDVLEMGHKYQAESVRSWVEPLLSFHPLAKSQPMATYAVACMYRLEAAARVAAQECVAQDLDVILKRQDQLTHVRLLSGQDLYHLLEYRIRCTAHVNQEWARVTHRLCDGSKLGPAVFNSRHPVLGSDCHGGEEVKISAKVGAKVPRAWFGAYIQACAAAIRTRVDPAVVSTVSLTGPVFAAVQRCSTCCSVVDPAALEQFFKLLEASLKHDFAQVSADLPQAFQLNICDDRSSSTF